MKTLTLKNVPDLLYERLTNSARRNRRSLNNEAIVKLEEATEDTDERERLDRIRRFREGLPKNLWVTDEDLRESRRELERRTERVLENLDGPATSKRTRKTALR
ncbi:MAG: hypothetical protein KBD94_00770 [Pyrinomonadaceae bacterium]|nr:hypothetical protein [Pyrinomonadaceae bacterium]